MDTLPEDQWRSDRLVLNGLVDPTGPHQTRLQPDYDRTTDFMVYSSVLQVVLQGNWDWEDHHLEKVQGTGLGQGEGFRREEQGEDPQARCRGSPGQQDW